VERRSRPDRRFYPSVAHPVPYGVACHTDRRPGGVAVSHDDDPADRRVTSLGETPPDRDFAEMTDRRAVGIGFVVTVVVGTLGLAVPVVGQILAGLVGGFVAGYAAGGAVTRGGWNGLLAGTLAGLVLTVVLVVLGLTGNTATDPTVSLVAGGQVLATGLVATAVIAIDSAAAGMFGAYITR
jgi:hypothetical protein